MKIAFLGTGRMGTELARHLLPNHELTVWNRTEAKAQPLVSEGAQLAPTPVEAVKDADVVITALFGPDQVRELVLDTQLIPPGVTWMDTTTVSPTDAAEFAAQVDSYVATPVVGSLGPARAGALGVYVGSPFEERRDIAADIAKPWADPQRLIKVDSAAKAATGKLLANLALAVSAQGFKEALYLGESKGLSAEEILPMLDYTGLAFISSMKGPFVTGERSTTPGDFTVDALAKDSGLMLAESNRELPATRAAHDSLTAEQAKGHGDEDFSAMLVNRNDA